MSPICISETSASRCSGTSIGSASTLTSLVTCVSTPPSFTPPASPWSVHGHGRVDRLVEPDFLQVDMRDVAANLVLLVLLEHRGVRLPAFDDDVEHGVQAAPRGERRAQVALGDRDRDRLLAAVEDARDQALAAQAPRLGRAEDGTVLDHQFDALSSHDARSVAKRGTGLDKPARMTAPT